MFYLTRFTSYIRHIIKKIYLYIFLKENLQEEIHHAAGVLDINAFEWKRLNEAKPHLSLASILKIALKVPQQLNWNSYDSWVITIFTCVIVTINNKHNPLILTIIIHHLARQRQQYCLNQGIPCTAVMALAQILEACFRPKRPIIQKKVLSFIAKRKRSCQAKLDRFNAA